MKKGSPKKNLKKAAQTPGLARRQRVKFTGKTGDKAKAGKKSNPGY